MELSGFSVASDAICRPSNNCLTRTSAREAIIKSPLLPWYRGLASILGPSAGEILLEHLNDEPGLAGMFYFDFNDILSENIQNQSWLTINGQTAEISMIDLHEVHFADSINAHLIKNLLSGG